MTDEEKIEKLQADVDRLNVGLGYIHINLELGHYSKALEASILLAKGGDIRDVRKEEERAANDRLMLSMDT